MNQPPNQKNEDVDGSSSASSGQNGAYVPPGRRNQILSTDRAPRSSQGSSQPRGEYGSNGNNDERFANFRQKDAKGAVEPRAPRSGSDNMGEKRGSSFFDRPNTSSAPRRSKWQDDDGGFSRDDRERGGNRSRKPQLGADGLTARDTRLEEELFGNHSNTGINFDKYQVRFTFHLLLCLPLCPIEFWPPAGSLAIFSLAAFQLPLLPNPLATPTRLVMGYLLHYTRCNHPAANS